MLIWVCSHFSAPEYAQLNIGEGEGAHLSENKGEKSEWKKFGKNSRQMAPVSTICDEYCSSQSGQSFKLKPFPLSTKSPSSMKRTSTPDAIVFSSAE